LKLGAAAVVAVAVKLTMAAKAQGVAVAATRQQF